MNDTQILESIDAIAIPNIAIKLGIVLGGSLVAVLFAFLSGRSVYSIINFALSVLFSPKAAAVYRKIAGPYQNLIGILVALTVGEVAIILIPDGGWFTLIELAVSLSITIVGAWLGSRLFIQFFDVYLLDLAFKSSRKVNSEILIVGKFLANFLIVVLAIILFAQSHAINVIGLVASLGVGGLAIAFAAQKTLEQLLGGIVIYIDKPFTVDDYIGLPDGTFGKVESIGLRSTKIRTSGKGTLLVVPNSNLTSTNIENFTGAKKVMSILYLTFYRNIPNDERALISQVIIDSTKDIFGIDTRSTDVVFREVDHNGNGLRDQTKAQVTFFILGSGEVSMDLRRQLLDIATQNITFTLKEYGIAFDIDEPTIYVDSPITI
ncbi:MscS Mechanosensitive ion channel [Thalassoporum mexicanum PCC 7367]|uniref:mechanosensitive ion channel family protein n=1 Tax=Thalassoporum mexicanum TaxID=3457544 RepID=UPI00029FB7E9|nr:mechanosensitive ion channel domain-containing protein [Pseudanabaena sp. PCC 7367]AFY70452.1 MscS Mechanosensitive ion channel [Pseudanabaena sp. PCC 7367]